MRIEGRRKEKALTQRPQRKRHRGHREEGKGDEDWAIFSEGE